MEFVLSLDGVDVFWATGSESGNNSRIAYRVFDK
jgi:hypothetical protein